MKFEDSFVVAASPANVWRAITDLKPHYIS